MQPWVCSTHLLASVDDVVQRGKLAGRFHYRLHLHRKLVPRKEEDAANLLKDGQHLHAAKAVLLTGQSNTLLWAPGKRVPDVCFPAGAANKSQHTFSIAAANAAVLICVEPSRALKALVIQGSQFSSAPAMLGRLLAAAQLGLQRELGTGHACSR
jgi:hypothetical protein